MNILNMYVLQCILHAFNWNFFRIYSALQIFFLLLLFLLGTINIIIVYEISVHTWPGYSFTHLSRLFNMRRRLFLAAFSDSFRVSLMFFSMSHSHAWVNTITQCKQVMFTHEWTPSHGVSKSRLRMSERQYTM